MPLNNVAKFICVATFFEINFKAISSKGLLTFFPFPFVISDFIWS